MPSINDLIASEMVGNRLDTAAFAENLHPKVTAHLSLMEDDLEKLIRSSKLDTSKRAAQRIARQEILIKSSRGVINGTYKDMRGALDRNLKQLAKVEANSSISTINQVARSEVAAASFTQNALTTIATKSPIVGSPAADWWSKQATDTRVRFEQQIRLGVTSGESVDEITKRVLGSRTGQRRVVRIAGKRRVIVERVGPVLNASKREARALVRTAVQTVANQTQLAAYRQNTGLIKGVSALVTLDNRTSDICMARSGSAWNLEDGTPLPESETTEPWPGPPPWHFQCRSILVPVLKSLEDVTGGKLKQKKVIGERASMDGRVPANLNFEQWLKTKGDDFAKRKLGAGRFQLWKEGKIGLRQLISNGKPLSLRELRARVSAREAVAKGQPLDASAAARVDVFGGHAVTPTIRTLAHEGVSKENIVKILETQGVKVNPNTLNTQYSKGRKLAKEGSSKGIVSFDGETRQLINEVLTGRRPPPPPPIPQIELPKVTPTIRTMAAEGLSKDDIINIFASQGVEVNRATLNTQFAKGRKLAAEGSRKGLIEFDKKTRELIERVTGTGPKPPLPMPEKPPLPPKRPEPPLATKPRTGKEVREAYLKEAEIIEKEIQLTSQRKTTLLKDLRARETVLESRIRAGEINRTQAYAELEPLFKQVRKLNDGIAERLGKHREAFLKTARVDNPIKVKLSTPGSSKVPKPWNDAKDFVEAITDVGAGGTLGDGLRIRVHALDSRRRAFALPGAKEVFVRKKQDVRTVVHEYMHIVETESDIWKRTKQFLADRAKADDRGLRTLRSITKKKGYGPDEVAWEDKFLHPYMGKHYGAADKSTELLTMGVETMYADPMSLAKKDPELFDMIIDALRGVKP